MYAPQDGAVARLTDELNRPGQGLGERIFTWLFALGMFLGVVLVPPFNVLFLLWVIDYLISWVVGKRKYRRARRRQRRAERRMKRRQGEPYLAAEEAEFDWEPPTEAPTEEFPAIRPLGKGRDRRRGRDPEQIRRDQLAFALEQEKLARP